MANGALKILFVEDHGPTARIVARLLSAEGHSVRIANTAAAAIELARHEPFDLLVSDLGLPDASGLELLRELTVQGHSLPAIAFTGYGQVEDFERSRRAGFQEHLVKPVDFPTLLAAILRVTEPTKVH